MNDGSRTDVSYFFKGRRNYVHGTTIFDSFLDALTSLRSYQESDRKRILVRQLKFITELRSNGQIEIINGEGSSRDTLLTSEMRCLVGEKPLTVCLFRQDNFPVTKRVDDEAGGFIAEIRARDFSGECVLRGVKDQKALMRELIEANKQIHLQSLKSEVDRKFEIRWIYIRNHVVDLEASLPEEIHISFRHAGSKGDAGGRTYTLNRGAYSVGAQPFEFELCFAYSE